MSDPFQGRIAFARIDTTSTPPSLSVQSGDFEDEVQVADNLYTLTLKNPIDPSEATCTTTCQYNQPFVVPEQKNATASVFNQTDTEITLYLNPHVGLASEFDISLALAVKPLQ